MQAGWSLHQSMHHGHRPHPGMPVNIIKSQINYCLEIDALLAFFDIQSFDIYSI